MAKLSKEARAKVEKMIKEETSPTDIAKAAKITVGRISQIKGEMASPKNPIESSKAKATKVVKAPKIKAKAQKQERKTWTEEIVKEMWSRRQAKKTGAEIGKEFGIAPSAISNLFKKHGLIKSAKAAKVAKKAKPVVDVQVTPVVAPIAPKNPIPLRKVDVEKTEALIGKVMENLKIGLCSALDKGISELQEVKAKII